MPVDAKPRPDGNVVIASSNQFGSPLVHVLHKGEAPAAGVTRYVAHFVSCPRASAQRRRGTLTVAADPTPRCSRCHYVLAPVVVAAGDTLHLTCMTDEEFAASQAEKARRGQML